MKRIVWKMPDGSTRYTTPSAEMLTGETEDQYLDRIAVRTKAQVPDLANAVRMPNITAEEHAAIRSSRGESE